MTGIDRWIQNRTQALGLVLLLFIFSVFIRLPNLNRPISKHYEFNTAVIMINIISWRQGGGGDQFHYTPVMNFQHPGDKLPPNNLFIDKNGNSVYLSFGPGWYLLSYFFYQLFQLPAEPLYLEILNLVFHLLTLFLFYYLLEKLIPSGHPRKYMMITAGCCFMIFSPGALWFLGNGYTNVSIMLPFILGSMLMLLPMLQNSSGITACRLSMLGLLIIILVYIDWYILFLSFLAGIMALLKIRQDKKYGWLFLVICLSVTVGILLIFFQFASYMGRDAVIHYWLSRSYERSFDLAGSTIFKRISFLFAYFFTSFLPLILLLLTSFLQSWRKKMVPEWSTAEILFLRLLTGSLILYNSFLFNWATDHEYPILPWGILLSFVAARFLGAIKNQEIVGGLLAVFLALSIAQYYWINRPGPLSRDGLAYNSFQKLGESLRQVPPEYTICINLEQNPMVEYYAGRNILRAPDSLSVKNLLKELGIKQAVWVSHQGYRLENIQIIQ
jgi:hypothetical protein